MKKVISFYFVMTFALAGCAGLKVTGAQQVGDSKSATWVYISAKDAGDTGIYRCLERNSKPICMKAEVQD
jgi:hypothetical protein